MSALTRRGFLGAGAGGTVAALTTVGPAYAGAPDTAGETGRAVGAPPAVTVTSDDFRYGDLTARGYNGRFVGKPDSVRIVHTTEQVTAAVAFGGRRTGYGIGPDHAVVLAVPRFAARHAADHIRDDRQRITLGPELAAGGAGPDERDVPALLRGACPYLPADAERDGPGAKPTAMVTTARVVRRAARLGWRAAYSGPDSMEVYNDLVVGKYSWVPDDEHPGPAASEMEHLPVHWLRDWMLCLDVECGMRPETVLHRLYGTVTSYEPGTGRVGFSPTGGHPAILVPVHRTVALSGDRQRRSDGQVPAHEPYEE